MLHMPTHQWDCASVPPRAHMHVQQLICEEEYMGTGNTRPSSLALLKRTYSYVQHTYSCVQKTC